MTGPGLRFLFQCVRESAFFTELSERGWFTCASFNAAFIACAINNLCTELDRDMPIFGNKYRHKQLDVACYYTKCGVVADLGRATSFISLLGITLPATFLFIRGILQACM